MGGLFKAGMLHEVDLQQRSGRPFWNLFDIFIKGAFIENLSSWLYFYCKYVNRNYFNYSIQT